MPKNPHQRPVPVPRNHNVPRHGAPPPAKRVEEKKVMQPKQDAPALPSLEALLARTKEH